MQLLKNKPRNLVLILLISFFGFLFLAANVNSLTVEKFDLEITLFIQNFRSETLTSIMILLTSLGETVYVIVVGLTVIFIIYISSPKKYIFPVIASIAFAGLFTYFFKIIFSRMRPPVVNALVYESGFSFPSGHTLIAICFYGLLTLLLSNVAKTRATKIIILLLGGLLIIAIGVSRIYLGVHWPSDVVGSLLLGCGLLSVIELASSYKSKG